MYKEVKHTGDGFFEVIMEDDSIKTAGNNLCGMIRYTYFEDYTIPPVGWTISRETLLKDYQAKVLPDIMSGKIKPGKHNF
jgi:hypothetical protein